MSIIKFTGAPSSDGFWQRMLFLPPASEPGQQKVLSIGAGFAQAMPHALGLSPSKATPVRLIFSRAKGSGTVVLAELSKTKIASSSMFFSHTSFTVPSRSNTSLKGTRLSEALFEFMGYIFTVPGSPVYWPARPLAVR